MTESQEGVRVKRKLRSVLGLGALVLAIGAAVPLGAAPTETPALPAKAAAPAPYPSTYRARPEPDTAIVNASILTATGTRIDNGTILMAQGRIVAVGRDVAVPAGARTIDGTGKWVTPGIIDSHSHLGVFPAPGVDGHADGNENIDPYTAHVWAEHSVWPQDPVFTKARAGGVTSLLVLPGSANLFGGRGVTLRNVPAVTVQQMKFPGAPATLKMACGENPKGRYGSRGRAPATRMGNVAGFRRSWIDAAEYARKWDAYERKRAKGEPAEAPKRDLGLETLAGVLKGEILVQNHCYRADEMAVMLDVGHEFGYRTTAFHHAVEAYKIADLLATEQTCVATWATRWGFKMEAFDGIEENGAILASHGVCVAIHSDEQRLIQRLNVEAAVALAAGRRAGIAIAQEEAIKWITLNPARIMGIADRTGSLEPGKLADVVLWSRNPFSVYAVAEKVFIEGALVHDTESPGSIYRSDFEVGQPVGVE
ncbi:MAG TPA: amidohydrolase [Novosphingobium sp.]|jgi:imidazolonepropionase-like amidohydrolase|nr:amidohydrolase [Novosphingobium sp.]HOA48136.1 amidohydrolase [Novosphingobium sp.]HPB23253.1 amidohydrolase [Novosphingobium sp.]HPZ45520.1 amidohydrolase [Novosphingobium sp.]HQD98521.1 amidohydrolase [Novosphingobium sp.]